jgi:hypothetical protein
MGQKEKAITSKIGYFDVYVKLITKVTSPLCEDRGEREHWAMD